jgi:prepilin-type N-terminal cleavage/methylation domain-containing protein
MTRRRGFTFIEILVVMIVLGILASLAILKYIDLRHRALSASATADLQTVRLAAYSSWYEHNVWPGEVGAGVVPGGLEPYLPGGFSFSKPEYTLDWNNSLPDGVIRLSVVVTSDNARLVQALQTSLGGKAPFFVLDGKLTFVIMGPDGQI